VKVGQKPTEEQLKQINELSKRPIHYTDDCPASTPEALKEFAMQRAAKNRDKKRQTVSVRLTPACLDIYKALGKGYTGVMAEVLTFAARNPDILKQATL
jgi:uncharacterized protein (DUF4415 family)